MKSLWIHWQACVWNRETSFVTYCTNGEGYHNYHHVFPYDYSASELGWKYNFNLSTFFIDLCAKVGLAYDLRRVPAALVANRVQRTGDKELHHKVATRAKTELLSNTIAQITFGTCHLWIPLLIRQWTFAAWPLTPSSFFPSPAPEYKNPCESYSRANFL